MGRLIACDEQNRLVAIKKRGGVTIIGDGNRYSVDKHCNDFAFSGASLVLITDEATYSTNAEGRLEKLDTTGGQLITASNALIATIDGDNATITWPDGTKESRPSTSASAGDYGILSQSEKWLESKLSSSSTWKQLIQLPQGHLFTSAEAVFSGRMLAVSSQANDGKHIYVIRKEGGRPVQHLAFPSTSHISVCGVRSFAIVVSGDSLTQVDLQRGSTIRETLAPIIVAEMALSADGERLTVAGFAREDEDCPLSVVTFELNELFETDDEPTEDIVPSPPKVEESPPTPASKTGKSHRDEVIAIGQWGLLQLGLGLLRQKTAPAASTELVATVLSMDKENALVGMVQQKADKLWEQIGDQSPEESSFAQLSEEFSLTNVDEKVLALAFAVEQNHETLLLLRQWNAAGFLTGEIMQYALADQPVAERIAPRAPLVANGILQVSKELLRSRLAQSIVLNEAIFARLCQFQ